MTASPKTNQIDLKARAHQEMIAAGFVPDFEPAVLREVQVSKDKPNNKPVDGQVTDLRSLLWSSIDNPESKDLDQIEYVERLKDGTTRVMIAIADVDSLVGKGSATDRHAYTNTTSV